MKTFSKTDRTGRQILHPMLLNDMPEVFCNGSYGVNKEIVSYRVGEEFLLSICGLT